MSDDQTERVDGKMLKAKLHLYICSFLFFYSVKHLKHETYCVMSVVYTLLAMTALEHFL